MIRFLSIILLNFALVCSGQTVEHFNKDELIKIIPDTLSTSNPQKKAEYAKYFDLHHVRLKMLTNFLPEIDADPISVAAHKASMTGDILLLRIRRWI